MPISQPLSRFQLAALALVLAGCSGIASQPKAISPPSDAAAAPGEKLKDLRPSDASTHAESKANSTALQANASAPVSTETVETPEIAALATLNYGCGTGCHVTAYQLEEVRLINPFVGLGQVNTADFLIEVASYGSSNPTTPIISSENRTYFASCSDRLITYSLTGDIPDYTTWERLSADPIPNIGSYFDALCTEQ